MFYLNENRGKVTMSDENGGKISVNFVLSVLRQHENSLDQLITELDLIVDKIGSLTKKIEEITNDISK